MTYLDHFKLNEAPFQLTPDPDFIYPSEQHTRAKSYMDSTIWFDDGFVVVTGDVGCGKTTILQSFISELDKDTVYAVITQTQLTPTEFLELTLHEFGFKPFGKGKVELLSMLNTFLIDQYAEGKKVVLIVDEAQNLSWQVLEEIRLLSGIESHKDKVLRIVLVGQPELKQTLESDKLKQLMQRVRCQLHLGPLHESEVYKYILHRLSVAGNKNTGLIDEDACNKVFSYTGGIPRLINTLCDTAFLCAFSEDRKTVSSDDVLSAIDELEWKKPEAATTEMPYLVRLAPLDDDSVMRIDVQLKGKTVSSHNFGVGRILIGRSVKNHISIAGKYISLQHAEIICTPTKCVIRDLDSTNGIFVHNDRVKEYDLKDKDAVKMERFELVYTDLRQYGKQVKQDSNGEDSAIEKVLA